jgi:hypothetical protein
MTTGPGVLVGMRWQKPLLEKIDSWAKQNDLASRGEAIRRLVEKGLGLGPAHNTSVAPQPPAPSTMTREQAAFLKGAREGL